MVTYLFLLISKINIQQYMCQFLRLEEKVLFIKLLKGTLGCYLVWQAMFRVASGCIHHFSGKWLYELSHPLGKCQVTNDRKKDRHGRTKQCTVNKNKAQIVQNPQHIDLTAKFCLTLPSTYSSYSTLTYEHSDYIPIGLQGNPRLARKWTCMLLLTAKKWLRSLVGIMQLYSDE